MGSKTIVFERHKLYDEVWTEPMTTVARRHELSDVGLRKICVKLEIPVPPRGYWARLEAGQRPEKPPLPQSDVRPALTRTVRIEHKDAELERRVIIARAGDMAAPTLAEMTYRAPDDVAELGPEAMQIAKAAARLKEEHGVIALSCGAWADLSVSDSARARALFVLDRLALTLKKAHCVFDLATTPTRAWPEARQNRGESENRGHFQIHGTKYFVRLKERIIKEEIIAPPPPPRPKIGRPRKPLRPDYSSLFLPKKYSCTPTGQLQLVVYRVQSTYETANVVDTANTVIEDKLVRLAERVESISLEQKLKDEIRQERQRESARKTKIWQVQKAQKDALLKQLDSFEKMAQKLDRAASLRRLAAKIAEHPNAPAELHEKLALLSTMADWLYRRLCCAPLAGSGWRGGRKPTLLVLARWADSQFVARPLCHTVLRKRKSRISGFSNLLILWEFWCR